MYWQPNLDEILLGWIFELDAPKKILRGVKSKYPTQKNIIEIIGNPIRIISGKFPDILRYT
jgi:hypothetical protein